MYPMTFEMNLKTLLYGTNLPDGLVKDSINASTIDPLVVNIRIF